MKQLLTCTVVRELDRAVAHLDGELDGWTAEGLFTRLAPLVNSGGELVVDLRALSFVSTTGLILLDRLGQCAAGAGGSLTVADPPAMVRRLLDVTGLGDHFTVHTRRPVPTS